MVNTMQSLRKDISALKQEIILVRHFLAEDFELSEKAKKEIARARATPKEMYISHENIKNRFL